MDETLRVALDNTDVRAYEVNGTAFLDITCQLCATEIGRIADNIGMVMYTVGALYDRVRAHHEARH